MTSKFMQPLMVSRLCLLLQTLLSGSARGIAPSSSAAVPPLQRLRPAALQEQDGGPINVKTRAPSGWHTKANAI